jgi:PKD repeat protein
MDEFTAGQSTRMLAALTVQRASYLAINGNQALVPPGAPVAAMRINAGLLCGTGQTVRLHDLSQCVPNSHLGDSDLPGNTHAWTITNGTETLNSTMQNPTFTLSSSGPYDVTLTVTTAGGTSTRTESGLVMVTNAPVAACTPTSNNTGNFALTVSQVEFNTISSSTSFLTNAPYTDFSCSRNTILAAGGTYDLSVTINGTGSNTQHFKAYIDWNNNGVFEDPAELVGEGTTSVAGTTITTPVPVPPTAVQNVMLRLRIYGEATTITDNKRNCITAFFVGDVEDYGVFVSPNVASVSIAADPGSAISYGTPVTFTPTPVNGGDVPEYQWFRNGAPVSMGGTLVLDDLLDGETVHCELISDLPGVIGSPAMSNTIAMVVTGPPLSDFTANTTAICAGGSVEFSDASLLLPTSWAWSFPGGTPSSSNDQNPTTTYTTPGVYAVTLTASNGLGTGTTVTKSGFITVYDIPSTACSITRQQPPTAGIGITRVQLNTIEHITPFDDPVMNDFTCSQKTTLEPGTTYDISVTVGNFNNQWVRVYIDYDGDGVFHPSNELVFSPVLGTGVRSGTFTTPATPPLNTLLRMRVISDFVNTTPGPCTNPQYGQMEEYGVVFASPQGVQLQVSAALDGAYNAGTGLMNDALRMLPGFPLSEPFSALGYTHTGAGGDETVAPAVLSVTGNDAIVDWVLLELRDESAPATVLASRSALLQRDGDVVDTDGSSPVGFDVVAGNYHVALLHRNHLGVMTGSPMSLGSAPVLVDFKASATPVHGTDARRPVAGPFPAMALWAGDVNFDGIIKYTGADNDRDPVLGTVGGAVPTATVNGYFGADVNMDGVVKYTGSDNDRDPILQSVGGSVPTAVRVEQVP